MANYRRSLKDGVCPVCAARIPQAAIDLCARFCCPSCGRELINVVFGRSRVASVGVLCLVFVGLMEQVFPWHAAIAVVLLFPWIRFVVSVLVSQVLGPTLEPYVEGQGHVKLFL
jgi:hypothetical protein